MEVRGIENTTLSNSTSFWLEFFGLERNRKRKNNQISVKNLNALMKLPCKIV